MWTKTRTQLRQNVRKGLRCDLVIQRSSFRMSAIPLEQESPNFFVQGQHKLVQNMLRTGHLT